MLSDVQLLIPFQEASRRNLVTVGQTFSQPQSELRARVIVAVSLDRVLGILKALPPL